LAFQGIDAAPTGTFVPAHAETAADAGRFAVGLQTDCPGVVTVGEAGHRLLGKIAIFDHATFSETRPGNAQESFSGISLGGAFLL
jgi:hypothetical protein